MDTIRLQADGAEQENPLGTIEQELASALSLYWSTAARILEGSGVTLLDPAPGFFSLENNFFSALFLYSYRRADIPSPRRILYATVNQCLRGMVTGCDNILDDEYKKTLETDLPSGGTRFRSILDIMVSDRVLFEILLSSCQTHGLTHDRVLAASRASLAALTKSGAQEASEETGIERRLKPEKVLNSVHHYKTGLLFQSPWAVPAAMESLDQETTASLLDALYRIGMGCQILDDMVDLARDLQEHRHNYVASLIFHDPDPSERSRLEARLASGLGTEEGADLLFEFSCARLAASKRARDLLESGAGLLFGAQHHFLVEPTISFLAKRIRADRFLSNPER